jgi:hypothetical protein
MKVFMSTWALNGGIGTVSSDIDGEAQRFDRTSAGIMNAEKVDFRIAITPAS